MSLRKPYREEVSSAACLEARIYFTEPLAQHVTNFAPEVDGPEQVARHLEQHVKNFTPFLEARSGDPDTVDQLLQVLSTAFSAGYLAKFRKNWNRFDAVIGGPNVRGTSQQATEEKLSDIFIRESSLDYLVSEMCGAIAPKCHQAASSSQTTRSTSQQQESRQTPDAPIPGSPSPAEGTPLSKDKSIAITHTHMSICTHAPFLRYVPKPARPTNLYRASLASTRTFQKPVTHTASSAEGITVGVIESIEAVVRFFLNLTKLERMIGANMLLQLALDAPR